MDAGEIALVGAVAGIVASIVGAGGAVVAARLTGRYQSRSQHAHWRRQVRRDAYAAFLNSVAQFNELRRSYREWTLLGQSMPEGTVDRLRELIRNIEKALFIVELEGPSDTAAQAGTVMRSIADWQASVIVSELRAARGVPPRDDVPSGDAMHGQINQSVAGFKAVARAALDAPDTTDRASWT
ncbi:hypothetical protein [Streptomyces albogriseolus]|uniref:hypothetical protein n=1 Tax=Streptomyces albogriseolus TaxID=1887 RepID=UPI00224D2F4D|nr:hypothetical protein [Streptomyces viridodiastaticus]MCX4568181.1 hypothetical protein [Streptomyces viridodiastaticus]